MKDTLTQKAEVGWAVHIQMERHQLRVASFCVHCQTFRIEEGFASFPWVEALVLDVPMSTIHKLRIFSALHTQSLSKCLLKVTAYIKIN